jgi:hypothetical protein
LREVVAQLVKVSRCPTWVTGIAGPEKPFEGSGLGSGLSGKAVGDFGDELVEGEAATRGFGLEAGLGLGGKIECHGHGVDCRGCWRLSVNGRAQTSAGYATV